MLRQQDITSRLTTASLGRSILTLEELESTNQTLLQLADAAPEGMIVTCETQSAGRGRHRRLWHSPPGQNLYFSMMLRPRVSRMRLPQIAMLAAVALHRMLRIVAPEMQCRLKWPNDVWCGERKLSGILCECPPAKGDEAAIVLGIGINVNSRQEDFPEELHSIATSMAIAAGHRFQREMVLAEFVNEFEAVYKQWQQEENLAFISGYWQANDLLKDRKIALTALDVPMTGTVTGYTPEGLMLLQTEDGTVRTISAGDVHLKL
ncbi:MAG: biotin--[acetyl-CoA-carboxylase] ligase [Victivallales bacterium]|nr:biotin--[acetyl-CoA-carboxylase] ligase [Victivallales bacterium]